MIKRIFTGCLFCVILAFALCSCGAKSAGEEVSKYSVSGTGKYLSVEESKYVSTAGSKASGDFKTMDVGPENPMARIGTEAEILPVSYTDRKFIKNVVVPTYDINLLPGNIVKYVPDKNDYEIVSLVRFVKNGEYPKNELIQEGILYDQKINSGASFNGSGLIANLSLSRDQMAEVLIQDISKAIIPDDLMLKEEIRAAVQKIPAVELDKYYFIRASVLTLINYRVYNRTNFNAGISCSYVTANKRVYSSTDKMKRERKVSLDLIALKDVI